MPRRLSLLLLLCLATCLGAAETPAITWPANLFEQPPKTYPAPEYAEPGLESFFYEGLSWQGKPTRVFAYLGLPEHPAGERVPAMVLVHGGGGTAFPEWVRLWTSRGYAAIAMDTCGSLPTTVEKKHPRHEFGGPPGWGGFDQTALPAEDQWTYHAIADVILGHTLLRSRPEVDASRVGMTGISWGGYLTCIAAGVDSRYRFAAPVYGCGYLGDDSTWLPSFAALGPEKAKEWLLRWDPSVYLPRVKMPMLWVDGTNDFAYPMDSLQRSYWLPTGPHTLCLRVRMPHGHKGPGEKPEEIHAFADHLLKGGPPLLQVSTPRLEGRRLSATWEGARPPASAELLFTHEEGKWQQRKWETAPATLAPETRTVSADLPEDTRVACLNLLDAHGLVVSTEHVEIAR